MSSGRGSKRANFSAARARRLLPGSLAPLAALSKATRSLAAPQAPYNFQKFIVQACDTAATL